MTVALVFKVLEMLDCTRSSVVTDINYKG